ncbi:MAG: hypothetical protein MI976_29100 [Pseudomonadales bacterium]|nr:hypothetical protein [Pseudomonadales bacterium]
MKYLYILILFLNPTLLFANDYPSCDVTRSYKLNLSGNDQLDSVEVSAIGDPCYKAKYKVVIRKYDGSLIYSYEENFKKLTPVQWDSKDLNEVAASLVEMTIASENFVACSDFVESMNKEKEMLSFYEAIHTIPKDVSNNRLCKVFTHHTHYEAWKSIMISSDLDEAKVVAEYGL